MFSGRYRVLVTVSAALPVSNADGEVVYNFRGSVDTANFLGQLFRTLSQVLNLGPRSRENQQTSQTGTESILYIAFMYFYLIYSQYLFMK